MWGFKKKSKAVKNWHSKAMMIDPRKTVITIIRTNAETINNPEEDAGTSIQLWHPASIVPWQLSIER